MVNVKTKYKHWLIDQIDTNQQILLEEYDELFDFMFDTDFLWFEDRGPEVAMDKNRASDGLYLRNLFDDITGNDVTGTLTDKEASVLEVLVALAIRIEQDIMGEGEDDFGKWFIEMLSNLGLLEYSDGNFDEYSVKAIFDRFMSRNYSGKGSGSLFPLKNYQVCKDDYRDLEIWSQLQYYLEENYR